MKFFYYWAAISIFIGVGAAEQSLAQSIPLRSLRALRSIPAVSASVSEQRLPELTVTGVSLETTASGGLTQTVSGLTKLSVDLPSQSGDKQQVQTYAGLVTRRTTLFDPASSRWEDNTSDQGPSQNDPFICGASAPGAPITNNGNAPALEDGVTDPNAGANNIALSAGTFFERNPYGQSGGATGIPLQLVPFPGRDIYGNLPVGTTFPNCGTNLSP